MKIFVYIGLAIVAAAIAAFMFQFAACRNPMFQSLCFLQDADY
jgi:hypothetical protein